MGTGNNEDTQPEVAGGPKQFWMVTLDGGQQPTARHATLEAAKLEAARLAQKQGTRAYVLAVQASCVPTLNVTWE